MEPQKLTKVFAPVVVLLVFFSLVTATYWALFREPLDIIKRLTSTKYVHRHPDAMRCRNTLDSLYVAFTRYALDWDGYLPVVTDESDWISPIDRISYAQYGYSYDTKGPELDKRMYECPTGGRYVFNLALSGKRLNLKDIKENAILLQCPGFVHDGIKNAITADGFTWRLHEKNK